MQIAQQGKLRTILVGLGAVGVEVARLLVDRRDVEIVGAIDTHPARAGKELGDVIGLGRPTNIVVEYDLEAMLSQGDGEIVLHATDNGLTSVHHQVTACVDARKHVISNCEELTFPWARYPELAERIDEHARRAGVCVLGAAVNPGFVMDTIPVLLTVACQQVNSVRVTRVVDAAPERLDLRSRCGIGLSQQGFQRAAAEGAVGYTGLRESSFMVADTLGWHLDEVTETIEPVIAPDRTRTAYFSVEKGCVAGLSQRVVGMTGGREALRLEIEVSLGARNVRDEIAIDGRPPIHVVIPGGIEGDAATAAVMVNCLPTIAYSGAAGLLSMRDMPIAPYRSPRGSAVEEILS